MENWMKAIADSLGTKHSDLPAVIRAGKSGAKKRTIKRNRREAKKDLKDQA